MLLPLVGLVVSLLVFVGSAATSMDTRQSEPRVSRVAAVVAFLGLCGIGLCVWWMGRPG